MRSIRASLFSREKLPSESSSSMSSEPSCPNVAEPNDSPLPEVVIAVDFGTTFSGFAYVKTSGPNEVRDNCAWPGSRQVGAETYCKTQTSLYYEHRPSTDGRLHLELKAWGWPAFLAFDRAVSEYVFRHNRLQRQNVSSGTSNSNLSSPITEDPLYASESLAMKVGFFAHRFKLYFAPHHHSISLPALPGNLTPEKLVVDYLRCFTEFIIDRLRVAIREDFSMNEVQWCLTVPAIWDEEAKQLMRTFAEKAGMTKGDLCPNNDEASPYPLRIILEPEAASVYCQDVASRNLQVFKGDKILIADLGGGTIDLAVHEVLEINASSEITKVREATSSYGAPGGGSFVDLQFFHLVNRKIKCFTDFCRNVNPSLGLDMYSWWQRFKKDYPGGDYSADYYLINSGLMDAWMRYDMERGVQKGYSEYSALHLCPADFTEIFDPQVVQAIRLIEENIGNVEILMIVGGFAANPYVKRRIQDAFKGKVKEIVIPMDPGRAICRGAASLFMKRGYIHSRISRRTYGVCSRRDYQLGDPDELVEAGDDGKLKCNGTFSVFVKKGTMLDVGSMQKRTYYPAFHDQKKIQFDLYSSPKTNPRYITEADAKNEGSFEIDISRGKSKGKDREIEVTMVFGDSLINVSAAGKNFGKNKATENYPVRFDRS